MTYVRLDHKDSEYPDRIWERFECGDVPMLLRYWLPWHGLGKEEVFASEVMHLNSAWGESSWCVSGYPELHRIKYKGGKICWN